VSHNIKLRKTFPRRYDQRAIELCSQAILSGQTAIVELSGHGSSGVSIDKESDFSTKQEKHVATVHDIVVRTNKNDIDGPGRGICSENRGCGFSGSLRGVGELAFPTFIGGIGCTDLRTCLGPSSQSISPFP
jgi:hypothetical protein